MLLRLPAKESCTGTGAIWPHPCPQSTSGVSVLPWKPGRWKDNFVHHGWMHRRPPDCGSERANLPLDHARARGGKPPFHFAEEINP
jgi:hypothetical protein